MNKKEFLKKVCFYKYFQGATTFSIITLSNKDLNVTLSISDTQHIDIQYNMAYVYDNEIASLIDIYFLRISFIPSDLFCYFIYVIYSTDN